MWILILALAFLILILWPRGRMRAFEVCGPLTAQMHDMIRGAAHRNLTEYCPITPSEPLVLRGYALERAGNVIGVASVNQAGSLVRLGLKPAEHPAEAIAALDRAKNEISAP